MSAIVILLPQPAIRAGSRDGDFWEQRFEERRAKQRSTRAPPAPSRPVLWVDNTGEATPACADFVVL